MGADHAQGESALGHQPVKQCQGGFPAVDHAGVKGGRNAHGRQRGEKAIGPCRQAFRTDHAEALADPVERTALDQPAGGATVRVAAIVVHARIRIRGARVQSNRTHRRRVDPGGVKALVEDHSRAVGNGAVEVRGSRSLLTEGCTEKAAADHRVLFRVGLGVHAQRIQHLLRVHVRAQSGSVDIGQRVTDVHVGVDETRQYQAPLQVVATGIGPRHRLHHLAAAHREDAVITNRQAIRPGLRRVQRVDARVVKNAVGDHRRVARGRHQRPQNQ